MKTKMKTIKSLILGALAVAGACVVQAETVEYLDPVFDAKGAVVRYETKWADCKNLQSERGNALLSG